MTNLSPDASDIVTLLVALISLWAARSAQKQSAKSVTEQKNAEKEAATITSRSEAETEAYIRARKMDVDTIERQDKELEDLNAKYDNLDSKYQQVLIENHRLQERVAELEKLVREQ